jgi:hypothetical protein
MKKEIPILFSTPMVQAIIEKRKTKTRRTKGLEFINESSKDFHPHQYLGVNEDGLHLMKNNYGATNAIVCPYGKPGDLLWVKENFKVQQVNEIYTDEAMKHVCIDFVASEGRKVNEMRQWFWLKKSETPKVIRRKHPDKVFLSPSIFLPKKCSRIWLHVIDVRIERLHSITKEEAMDEGIEFEKLDGNGYKLYRNHLTGVINLGTAVESFQTLWKKINGEESWNQNPWVWVVSFKVISTTGKPYITKAENYDFNCHNNLQTS